MMPIETSKLVLTIDANGAVKSAEDLNDVLEDLDNSGEKTSNRFLDLTNKSIDLSGAYKGLIASAIAYISVDTVRHVIQSTTEMAKMANQLGLTVEELSRLEYATTAVGVSTEFLRDGIADMNEKIGEARIGSGTLNDHLSMTNPALLEQVKNTRSSADAFRLLLGELERTTNAQDRTILATELFGEAGKQLVDVAELGAEGLEAMADEADRLGVTISTKTAQDMQEFSNDVEVMKTRLLAGARVVVSGMLPALNELSNGFSDSTSDVGLMNFYLENLGITIGNTAVMFASGIGIITGGLQIWKDLLTDGEISTATQALLDESAELFANGTRNLLTFEEFLARQTDETNESISELNQTLQDLENTLNNVASGAGDLAGETARLENAFWNMFYAQNDLLGVQKELGETWEILNHAIEQGYISVEEADAMFERHRRTIDGTDAQLQNLRNQYRSLRESVDEQYRAENDLNEVTGILNSAFEQGWITMERYNEVLNLYRKSVADASTVQDKFTEDVNETNQLLFDLGSNLLLGVSDQLISGSDDWREYARTAVQEIGRVITQLIVMNALSTAVGSGAGSKSASFVSAPSGAKISAFADGGVVDSPTLFPMSGNNIGLMGEAGAEAILPLKRDSQGRLGVSSSGVGQTVNVKNEYNIASGTSPETIKELYKFADQRAQATKKEILTDISRGGQFARAVGRRA